MAYNNKLTSEKEREGREERGREGERESERERRGEERMGLISNSNLLKTFSRGVWGRWGWNKKNEMQTQARPLVGFHKLHTRV